MRNSKLKIGIQGIRASFHDLAARKYFSGQELDVVECDSFKRLCQTLANKESDFCMMAIENSIAGSILPNYSLLESYGFKILGETYLKIEMCLLALPGQKISDIRVVQSHPMAILQCEEFLSSLSNVQVLELADTAESAKLIADRKSQNTAAIANSLAAKTYELEVLRDGIETNHENYTRFLTICRAADYSVKKSSNKASIRFEAPHRPGSLADILDILKRNSVNLTKIQSVPILGRPYQYSFHMDLEWENPEFYASAMENLEPAVMNLIHFGEYERGDRPGL